ncbi:histone acetyltransferase [Acrasis kona]|uniref:Histone acetyltransferase n=1 Tax=Acrasis kona TaxID=1008807 RepID=A0AAW2Z1N2_9EUKA
MFGGSGIDQFMDCTEFQTLELDAEILKGDDKLVGSIDQESPIYSEASIGSEDEVMNTKTKKKNKKSVERELRLLMPDYRPSRPWKPHTDEKMDLFYDNIYHVWKKVFDHEVSWPFRKPVTKKEAGDYLDVIKEPMDLSTIQKKIKNSMYNSKEDFERDLRLMFNNCRIYNTDGTSVYRKCCHELENYTDHLLRGLQQTLPTPKKENVPKTRIDPFDRDLRWNALTIKDRLPVLQRRQSELGKKIGDQMSLVVSQSSLVLESKKRRSVLAEYSPSVILVPNVQSSASCHHPIVVPVFNQDSQLTKNVAKLFALHGDHKTLSNNTNLNLSNQDEVCHYNASKTLLTPIVSLFLAHEGFSSASSTAMSVLVDLLQDHLLQFGKALNKHVSTNTNHAILSESIKSAYADVNQHDPDLCVTDLVSSINKNTQDAENKLLEIERNTQHV